MRLLTTGEVAEQLRVSEETVRRYIEGGQLPAIRLPGGHYRVRQAAVTGILESGVVVQGGAA